MNRTTLAFFIALFTLTALKAQPPTSAFDLRPVLVPGTVIDGQIFSPGTILGSTAINDAGEIAFTAYCDGQKLFTSRRIVAREGDAIGGKFIEMLRIDSPLAINSRGEVAYQAWYADTKEIAVAVGEPSGLGIFVDDRLALTLTSDNMDDPFTLSDDGQVVLQPEAKPNGQAPGATAPPTKKKPGMLDRIRIIPPKIPKGFPVSVDPNTRRQPAHSATNNGKRPALPDPLPFLRANRRGQVVIPVNLGHSGFMLLLASPISH